MIVNSKILLEIITDDVAYCGNDFKKGKVIQCPYLNEDVDVDECFCSLFNNTELYKDDTVKKIVRCQDCLTKETNYQLLRLEGISKC